MRVFEKIKTALTARASDQTQEAETAEVIEAEPQLEGWYTLQELLNKNGGSGVRITPDSAFSRIGTVFACVDRRATTLAKLPFQVFHIDGERRERARDHRLSYLLEVRPNRYQSPTAYKKYIMACQLLWGFACIYKKYDATGQIAELIPWSPKEVGVHKLLGLDEYVYQYRGRIYTEDEVIYIPYLSADGKHGKAPMSVARESAEAVQRMKAHLNNFYKTGAVRQGALKLTQPLGAEGKKKLKWEWARLHGGENSSGEIAVLDNGMEWQDISLPMTDVQFIESQQMTALDIASVFNVPASSVGLASEKYSNLQEINDRFIQDVVAPDCINIEEAHNHACFLERERDYYTKFNLNAGMRGSSEKRVAYYKEMIANGVMTINEVRALEEMNGIGEIGDKHYLSLNFTTLDTLEKHIRIAQDAGTDDKTANGEEEN